MNDICHSTETSSCEGPSSMEEPGCPLCCGRPRLLGARQFSFQFC